MDERRIDLHTHSYISDGSDSPSGVVAAAKRAGLAAVALTDHDEVAGIDEAMRAGEALGVEVVPGIELSGHEGTEAHILGYYPDTENAAFAAKLAEVREVRARRMEVTAQLCAENGVPVTLEEAAKFAGAGMVCRVHFARAMAEKGYAASVKEAFDRWLGNGCPCHYDLHILTPADAVRLLKGAGAAVYLAHLNQLQMDDDALRAFLRSLVECGLDGVEGWYTEYTPETQTKYQGFAREFGLSLSGGSDYHGTVKPHIAIGRGTGSLEVPYSALETVKRRAGRA